MTDPADTQILLPALHSRPTVRQWIMLSAILLAATILRFDQIGSYSLWMDEIWTIEIATGRGSAHDLLPQNVIQTTQPDLTSLTAAPPPWAIWTHMTNFLHPPLYYILLRLWMDVFGNGPVAARTLSALFSIAGVYLMFDIARLLHGPRVGLLAAAIMALSITQIDYGQQVRSYAMLTCVALWSADILVRIEKLPWRNSRAILLGLAILVTAMTHYFSLGVLLALGVYSLLALRGRPRKMTLGAFAAAAVLALIIWGPQIGPQLRSTPPGTPIFLQESPGRSHFAASLLRLTQLPTQLIFGEGGYPNYILAPIVLLLALRVFWRRDILIWVLWLAGDFAVILVQDLSHNTTLLQYLRYTVLAGPAVCAILASVDWPPKVAGLRDAVPILILLCLTFTGIQRISEPVQPRQDFAELAKQLHDNAGPDDLIAYFNFDPWNTPGLTLMAYRYYSPDSHQPWILLSKLAPANLPHDRRVWLVILDNEEAAIPTILPDWRVTGIIKTSAGDIWRLERMP